MPKKERDAELRLDDILQAIARIRTYTEGMAFEDFSASHLTFDAVAMNVLGFELVRDVAPGEAVFISADGNLHTQQCAEQYGDQQRGNDKRRVHARESLKE